MGNCICNINNISDEELSWFSLEGMKTKCKVISVYDGDTITVRVSFRGKDFKTKVRLAKIDTPEIRTKNTEEKKAGQDAKKFLDDLISKKYIWIHFQKNDKYGRPLGVLYLTKSDHKSEINSVNDLIVKKHYGYYYDGGKKLPFGNW